MAASYMRAPLWPSRRLRRISASPLLIAILRSLRISLESSVLFWNALPTVPFPTCSSSTSSIIVRFATPAIVSRFDRDLRASSRQRSSVILWARVRLLWSWSPSPSVVVLLPVGGSVSAGASRSCSGCAGASSGVMPSWGVCAASASSCVSSPWLCGGVGLGVGAGVGVGVRAVWVESARWFAGGEPILYSMKSGHTWGAGVSVGGPSAVRLRSWPRCPWAHTLILVLCAVVVMIAALGFQGRAPAPSSRAAPSARASGGLRPRSSGVSVEWVSVSSSLRPYPSQPMPPRRARGGLLPSREEAPAAGASSRPALAHCRVALPRTRPGLMPPIFP